MDIKQLQYFVAIVEEKTISAAAKKLHITQPPLSNAIKNLEEELGTTLFLRGNRSISLTDSGKVLYTQACALLDLYRASLDAVKDSSHGIRGALKIGIISSSVNSFLEWFAQDFHKQYPDIRFELFEGNTYELIEMLQSRQIEIAFVRSPFPPGSLEYFPIKNERLKAFGTAQFLGNRTSISFDELSKLPLVVYRRWLPILRQEFENRGIFPSFSCINDDARTAMAWIERGMGVGILPESSSHILPNSSICTSEIPELTLSTEIVCMYAAESYRSASTQLLLDFIRQKTNL